VLVNSGVHLVLHDADDLVENTGGNGSLLQDPRDVGNVGNDNWVEILFVELAALGIVPSKGSVVVREHPLNEFDFLRLKETVFADFERCAAFFGKTLGRSKRGRMKGKWFQAT
jgi:hypothetical protein